MRMEKELDAGPILLQVEDPIRPDESGSELALRLSEIGAEALVETLTLMSCGMLEERVQDHARATYAPKLDRESARVDWAAPAIEVARLIRGLDSVPGAWSPLAGGQPIKLYHARVEPAEGAPGQVVAADDEGVLVAAGRSGCAHPRGEAARQAAHARRCVGTRPRSFRGRSVWLTHARASPRAAWRRSR